MDDEADEVLVEVARIAEMLVHRHGSDAMAVAQVSARGALLRDRFDEYLVWQDIKAATAKLIACPMPHARIH